MAELFSEKVEESAEAMGSVGMVRLADAVSCNEDPRLSSCEREFSDNAPPYLSRELKIAEIPSAIMEMHNEEIHFLDKWGVKDAISLHVDGHPDMTQGAPYIEQPGPGYYRHLDHASFRCPEVHYNMVSSIYWLNPHSQRRRLQLLGRVNDPQGKTAIRTQVDRVRNRILWATSGKSQNFMLQGGTGSVIDKDTLARELGANDGRPFVLDTDLDAFACRFFVYWKEPGDDTVREFRRRIDETLGLLAGLGRRPDYILITRTQGEKKWVTKVEKVQAYFVAGLEAIYG